MLKTPLSTVSLMDWRGTEEGIFETKNEAIRYNAGCITNGFRAAAVRATWLVLSFHSHSGSADSLNVVY